MKAHLFNMKIVSQLLVFIGQKGGFILRIMAEPVNQLLAVGLRRVGIVQIGAVRVDVPHDNHNVNQEYQITRLAQ